MENRTGKGRGRARKAMDNVAPVGKGAIAHQVSGDDGQVGVGEPLGNGAGQPDTIGNRPFPQVVYADPILPREAFGFDPETDYQPGGDDAKILDPFGTPEGDDAPAEPKLTVIKTPDANTWDQLLHVILQHEKAAVAEHHAKRIVRVTAPDLPGRPDFADGVYSGFPVEYGDELTLHFNDGSKIKP